MSGAAVLPPVAPGWDCHVHVFDEAAPAAPGHYQAAHRPLEDIEALAATQGLGHLVLVQPSVYGNDHRVMLQALRQRPGRHAGVAVVDAGVSDATLDDLHAAGVRGARFNLVSPVGNRDSEAPALLAPRLAARGWHIQWYARAADLPAATAQVRQNLALLLALKGDGAEAERLARRDLPPEQARTNGETLRALATAARR